MADGQQTIYLADYQPPAFLIEDVHLTFRLAHHATRVISKIRFAPNPASPSHDFRLDGEGLKLISAQIDGTAVKPDITENGLTCPVPDGPFTWEAEVEIDPGHNTALEGLYLSNGMYCTQCEAEGFRRITYYPDRPDVMAPFTVRVEGDLPVLLSNGNPIGAGDGWAEWHDPWPKPAYLFGLVAGDLVAHSDCFTTMEGCHVDLNIYVRPADLDKCAYGMEALKRSMVWDEQTYGRAYDLDVFNIVAVDDFNAGAMENKGLNIFNASYVLASAETATDGNFETIEAVIAHEYFHNWTGNRITCRDWFQLCLKEGLTVFRDQQFTGDMRSVPVKRIEDAITLRAAQFREDAGPLAHPVRPASFVEINNFYTATVYEKGAEVIGMLKTLIEDDAYAKGCTLYFDRHDGDAATIEDWLACFAEVTGRDLSQFQLWYSQAGTPRLHVTEGFQNGTYTLTLRQDLPATPGQPDPSPMLIPLAMGLLNPDGSEAMPTQVLELTDKEQTYTYEGLVGRPLPSLLRNFSAPVILHHDLTAADRAILLAHDTDPFNRWEAGRILTRDTLRAHVIDGTAPQAAYVDGLRALLTDRQLDPAFRALVLRLPTESDTAQDLFDAGHTPDPDAIHTSHETLRKTLALALDDDLQAIFDENQCHGPYSPDAKDAGKRSLANAALSLISRIDGGLAAQNQFQTADNMTQSIAALSTLLRIGQGEAEAQSFAAKWAHERLVMDKWFALRVSCSAPNDTVATALKLSKHPDFDRKNPNRFRSVFSTLMSHQSGFHTKSGAGYKLLADELIGLDALNPQTAAKMATAFQTLHRWDDHRQSLMRAELGRIAQTPGLSGDTKEIVTRILG